MSNPFVDGANFGDLLNPAMKIAESGDKAKAAEYVDQYMAYLLHRNPEWTIDQARQTVLRNIGYYAGYYGYDTMKAVSEVFGAAHPVLGG